VTNEEAIAQLVQFANIFVIAQVVVITLLCVLVGASVGRK